MMFKAHRVSHTLASRVFHLAFGVGSFFRIKDNEMIRRVDAVGIFSI